MDPSGVSRGVVVADRGGQGDGALQDPDGDDAGCPSARNMRVARIARAWAIPACTKARQRVLSL